MVKIKGKKNEDYGDDIHGLLRIMPTMSIPALAAAYW